MSATPRIVMSAHLRRRSAPVTARPSRAFLSCPRKRASRCRSVPALQAEAFAARDWIPAFAGMARGSLRRHLQLSEGGAAKAFGGVHGFGRRRWPDVVPGRDGAHDIGEIDERRLPRLAVEHRDETVVAIFAVLRR